MNLLADPGLAAPRPTQLRSRAKLIPRRVAAANSRDRANFYGVRRRPGAVADIARQVFVSEINSKRVRARRIRLGEIVSLPLIFLAD